MAKYDYDKSVLKGLGIGDFMNEVKVRQSYIEVAGSEIPPSIYNPNRLAADLHPNFILGKIKAVHKGSFAVHYVIAPYKEGGFASLPAFRAGQYISFEINTGKQYYNRSYTLCGSPKAALDPDHNTYEITVADRGPQHVSAYIHENWKIGTIVCFSAPLGQGYYEPLRDAENILAVGTGSVGLSMARAIADEVEAFNLTILSIASKAEMLPMRSTYESLAAESKGKIRYIPVLLDEDAPECERGPVKAELLQKYMTDPATGEQKDTSIFIEAPNNLADPIEKEAEKLGLPKRRIRKELTGDLTDVCTGDDYLKAIADVNFKTNKMKVSLGDHIDVCSNDEYLKKIIGNTFKIKVLVRGQSTEIECPSDLSLLKAMENAGLHIGSDCRTGICGWCHSRWISGDYYMPKSRDGRREADRKFGWIHPCCTYPLSNMTIEIFPVH